MFSSMQAVKSNRPAVLRQLICINGADITHANRQYHEPIHTAAERGHRRCLGILLEHKSAVDSSITPDRVTSVEQMKTPLMIASSRGRPGTVKFLLDRGADANRQVCINWLSLSRSPVANLIRRFTFDESRSATHTVLLVSSYAMRSYRLELEAFYVDRGLTAY
jgi:ankyrin repeat protein